MLYTRKSFTVPASQNTDQRRFDYATMKEADFVAKYGEYTVEPTFVQFHTDKVPATLPAHSGSTLVVKQ